MDLQLKTSPTITLIEAFQHHILWRYPYSSTVQRLPLRRDVVLMAAASMLR